MIPYVTGNTIGNITDHAYIEAYPVYDSNHRVGSLDSALTISNTNNLAPNDDFADDFNERPGDWFTYNDEVQWDQVVGRNDPGSARFDLVDKVHRRLYLDLRDLNPDLKSFTTYTLKFWLRTEGLDNAKSPYVRIHRLYEGYGGGETSIYSTTTGGIQWVRPSWIIRTGRRIQFDSTHSTPTILPVGLG